MAISFARLEFVQRSAGKNSCAKSAYNACRAVYFNGTSFQEAKNYNWSNKDSNVYHTILLPKNADPQFKNLERLWNAVEQKENRINSQTAFEIVLALPDDLVISDEDRKFLATSFIQKHFVDKGLISQIDIHAPAKKNIFNPEIGEIEGYNHNWHAHALIVTRLLKENGTEFCDHKARDLMPEVRKGQVIAGEKWSQLWTNHQNEYFEQKGLTLRVTPNAIVSQKHLGPVRMRHPSFKFIEHDIGQELNEIESKNCEKILQKITANKSIFTAEDVERFLMRYVKEDQNLIRSQFWKQDEIIQLNDTKTKEPLNKFTSQSIINEEQKIIRLADSIQENKALNTKNYFLPNHLINEQKTAFQNIVKGQKLTCIEGFAGTGKSHLLKALRDFYVAEGYVIRGFGPDHATVKVLKDKEFTHAQTIHSFLWGLHHNKQFIQKEKEIWVLDEAGKLSNQAMLELLKFAKQYKTQIIFAGDSAQFSSVARGGMYKNFCERYGAQSLVNIQRQKHEQDRVIAKKLAIGEMALAIDLISNKNNLKWFDTLNESKEALIKKWVLDREAFPQHNSLIIAHANQDVKQLNELVRLYRKEKGELGLKDYQCESIHGKILVSTGDKIEFRGTYAPSGLTNGMTGTLIKASSELFTVKLDNENNRQVNFNPKNYTSFQLAYATTNYRSQGKTVDRTYVLHSKTLSKAGFYVSLTRHKHQSYLFVSKTEASCLTSLKRQAYKSSDKETTLNFTNHNEIVQNHKNIERCEYIQSLQENSSIVSKLKGYTLSTLDHLKNKFSNFQQTKQDLKPNQTFYNPSLISQARLASPALEVRIDYYLGRQSVTNTKIQTEYKEQIKSIVLDTNLIVHVMCDFLIMFL